MIRILWQGATKGKFAKIRRALRYRAEPDLPRHAWVDWEF